MAEFQDIIIIFHLRGNNNPVSTVLFSQDNSIMKTTIFCLLAFAPAWMFAQTTETRTVDSFTGVSTSALVEVELKPGSPCAVTLEGETEATQSITTEVKDGIL